MFLNLVFLVPDDTSVCCEDLRVENCECKRRALNTLVPKKGHVSFLVLGVPLLMCKKSHVQAQCGPHQVQMTLEFYAELILSKGFWNHVEKCGMSFICQRVKTSTRQRQHVQGCANATPTGFRGNTFTKAVLRTPSTVVGIDRWASDILTHVAQPVSPYCVVILYLAAREVRFDCLAKHAEAW